MGKGVVKGKWLRRLPFVRDLFESRIKRIEKHDVEVSSPAKTIQQLRQGVRGKTVKPRYLANFLDVFKAKRTKLRKKVRSEPNEAHRKKLRLELKALEKAIASVEHSLGSRKAKKKSAARRT